MMTHRFTVTRSTSELSEESWEFTVIDNMLVVDLYTQSTRPSKRHKFRPQTYYTRLGYRRHDRNQLTEEQVPTPQDVFDEALAAYIKTIRVGLWKRDFGR